MEINREEETAARDKVKTPAEKRRSFHRKAKKESAVLGLQKSGRLHNRRRGEKEEKDGGEGKNQ